MNTERFRPSTCTQFYNQQPFQVFLRERPRDEIALGLSASAANGQETRPLCLQHGLLNFVAGFERHVSIPEFDTDLLKESARRFATGKDPNIVVGNLAGDSIDFQDGFVSMEFSGQ